MSYFLQTTDEEADAKLNLDDLYEKRQKQDLKQLSIFKKILNRIHVRIKKTAQNKLREKYIWYNVPEYIFGENLYDKGDCIAYLIYNLEQNKFHVRYVHPNTLFISWEHWVPAYVRNEFKKKTGATLDEFGNVRHEPTPEELAAAAAEQAAANAAAEEAARKTARKYKPPTFIYGDDVLERLEQRLG